MVYFAANKKHKGFYATPSGHQEFAVNFYLFMMSGTDEDTYGLFTFPDEEKNIIWFEQIISCLFDFNDAKIKKVKDDFKRVKLLMI